VTFEGDSLPNIPRDRYNIPRDRYIARHFFLQSNTRVCRSKLPSGWRPRVIFLLQTLVCEDCSKKFPAIYLSLGILYMKIKINKKARISSWLCLILHLPQASRWRRDTKNYGSLRSIGLLCCL
jgi:hypothetical protein